VKLTLIVPKRTYPRNALVRVTIRMKNASHRAVMLQGACGYTGGVQVINNSGQAVYSPPNLILLPGAPPITGCAPYTLPFDPGQQVTERPYLVLAGTRIQAWDIVNGKTLWVAMRVRLTTATPPTVTLHQSPTVSATIHPIGPVSGHLYFIAWTGCDSTPLASGSSFLSFAWRPSAGATLFPQCSDPTEWHALAGWLDQPMAHIDYVKR